MALRITSNSKSNAWCRSWISKYLALEEAGARMEHVTKLVVYLTDIRHREAVYRTMGEYIRKVHPVCTGLVVVALARPEWLVEIDATAVIPD